MITRYKTINGFHITLFNQGGYQVSKDNEIIEINPRILKVRNKASLFYAGPLQLMGDIELNHPKELFLDETKWIGCDPKDFEKYRHWINLDATCGMMSAAVLLAYYQDNVDSNLIDDSIRSKNSTSYGSLYPELLKNITSFAPQGTIAYDVSMGINRYLRKIGKTHLYKAKGSLVPTFGIVSTKLKQSIPKPSIVGLNTLLGSPKNYLNHWVVAYRYTQIGTQKFYQVHDNHGRYNAIINARWTIGVVRLLKK